MSNKIHIQNYCNYINSLEDRISRLEQIINDKNKKKLKTITETISINLQPKKTSNKNTVSNRKSPNKKTRKNVGRKVGRFTVFNY